MAAAMKRLDVMNPTRHPPVGPGTRHKPVTPSVALRLFRAVVANVLTAGNQRGSAVASPTMKTILVVDDDFDVRDSLSEILRDEGFAVAAAGDGLEALAYLRREPAPALILLDWMMPRCDGARFRQEQLADPRLAPLPVVVLTADTRAHERAQAAGVDGFLCKPVKLDRLLDLLAGYA
jgi:CheY-like chemotaxis protein